MNKLLIEFEGIVILRTIVRDVNLNFLCKEDLEHIEDVAYELGIELPLNIIDPEDDEIIITSLEDFYDSQYEMVKKVFECWNNLINDKYLNIRKRILYKLNG